MLLTIIATCAGSVPKAGQAHLGQSLHRELVLPIPGSNQLGDQIKQRLGGRLAGLEQSPILRPGDEGLVGPSLGAL